MHPIIIFWEKPACYYKLMELSMGRKSRLGHICQARIGYFNFHFAECFIKGCHHEQALLDRNWVPVD